MNITIKLYAMLGDYLPGKSRDNIAEIDIPEDQTVAGLIEQIGIPPAMAHLVLINGVYVEPGARATQRLSPADALAIWPPVAGG